jgi:hypothetical protein
MKKSHSFLFLGGDVEVVQVGPDSFEDVWTDPESGDKITAKNLTANVRIKLPGQSASYETRVPWPAAGEALVELAPAVLEALDYVDPHQDDNSLRDLCRAVEEYLEALGEDGYRAES